MTEQLLLHGIAVYNPGILSKEELKRYFVARQPLLKKLLDELKREQSGKTPQHRLIVGTRGMGKTTLLHRFALAVAENAILSAHWLPLTFPEEQYNIARLSDLWVNCLDALGDSLEASGNSDLLDELDACVDELPSEEDERAKTALQALMDFADRLGRRLLLLIDSLDIVLERLKKSHWEIREVLGHEPRLMLVGASARVLEVTYEYESAFYDFFKIHELKGLGEDEMRDVLCRLAEVDNNTAITRMIEQQPARLRALHTLTGGNPRTAVWLYGVLAQGIEGDVRSDLERLLDQSTPLYKARFEELPAQSQKVVDAMAIHWDPLTARQLAERTRLPVNTVSTQVVRLADQGVVEKVPLRPGKKNGFQIAERFFNIWYLMRASRRVRRRLIWLVQFLKIFYSQDELKVRAHHHLHNGERGGSDDRIRHAEYAFSLASAVDDPIISSALERSALQTMLGDSKLKKELAALLRFDDPDGKLKALADPLEFMQELKDRVIAARTQWPSGIEADAFASALKGSLTLTPEEKRQVIEALPDWENGQIVQFNKRLREEKSYWEARFLGHSALIFVIRRAVVEGHMAKIGDAAGAQVAANLLPSKLLSAYADVARLGADPAFFSLTELHTLRDAIETFGLQYAWHVLGFALYKQDDLDGAINAYRQQLEINPDHEWAWNNLGVALDKQGNSDGAIDAYRQQIKVKPDHEGAWNNLGAALDKQGDPDGAIDAFRQQIKVNPDHEVAWNNLGSALGKQGDPDGAIDAFRQQIKVNPDHEVAWNNLGIVLYDQCDPDSAIKAFRQQIKVNPNHEEARYNLGTVLGKQGDLDGAIEAYRQQLEINPDHEWAWNNLGAALGTQSNLDEAINALRQQIKVNPNHEEAWYNLGGALGKQGDLDGAINAYRQGMRHPLIKGQCHNALAWLYYEQQQNLDEAVELARTAVELDPEAPDARHTLATLLISSGNWAEAQIEATAFLQLGEPDWLETGWEDLLRFFLEAVRHNRATESVRLLEDTKSTERLRPLYVALKTLAEGPDQLTQVAPEVRQPAQALIKQFNEWLAAMESDAAASTPQSPRGGVD